jgi:hypothetical protein
MLIVNMNIVELTMIFLEFFMCNFFNCINRFLKEHKDKFNLRTNRKL